MLMKNHVLGDPGQVSHERIRLQRERKRKKNIMVELRKEPSNREIYKMWAMKHLIFYYGELFIEKLSII